MGLLFSPPPDSLFIDGKEYPINTDFRVWLSVLYLLSEPSAEKASVGVFAAAKAANAAEVAENRSAAAKAANAAAKAANAAEVADSRSAAAEAANAAEVAENRSAAAKVANAAKVAENRSAAAEVATAAEVANAAEVAAVRHSEIDKLVFVFSLIFKGTRLPRDLNAALCAISDFLSPPVISSHRFKSDKSGGKSGKAENRNRSGKVFDFDADFGFIYSAFLEQYGIDLFEENLHFWKFMALFLSLSKDTALLKIIKIRSSSTQDIKDPSARAALRKMKRFYALPLNAEDSENHGCVSSDDISAELDKLF